MWKCVILLGVLTTNVFAKVTPTYCEYSKNGNGFSVYTWETWEHYASNGDCCSPSQGWGTYTKMITDTALVM
jgi:hypothetical protein